MAKGNRYYSGPVSDHFDGTRFLNPAGEPGTDRSLRDILRWRREAPKSDWPARIAVEPDIPDPHVAGLRVTMVGHATVLIQMEGVNLLTDPVWSDRASPLAFAGPRRVTAPGIAIEDLPPIDAILLSHNHYDHLDKATIRALCAAHDPLIVTPLGNDTTVRAHVRTARCLAGDWGDTFQLGPKAGTGSNTGLKIHIVPALHWSARRPGDRRMALWGGFVVEGARHKVYFAGDTGYGTGQVFRDIGTRFGPIDLALLPIGAYDPRWFMSAQHTNPEEAVQIMEHLGARYAAGIHWGSFRLTDEPRLEPAARLHRELTARGIDPRRFPALSPADRFDLATAVQI